MKRRNSHRTVRESAVATVFISQFITSKITARINYSSGGRLRGRKSQKASVHVHRCQICLIMLFYVSVVGNSQLLRFPVGPSVINTPWS